MKKSKVNIKKVLLLGTLILSIAATSGCSKVKDIIPNGKSKEPAKVAQQRPSTLGQYQDLITQKAAMIIAEKYNIDVSAEAVRNFITNTVGDELDNPTQLLDVNNNPKVIREVIGDNGYVKSFIPPYVEEKLGQLLEEKYAEVSAEDIEKALVEYKSYLDSLGIQEEAREDYVKYVLSLEAKTMQIDQEYYDAYAQAAISVMQEFTPEFYETLDLK